MIDIRGHGMRNMCRVCLSGDGSFADLYADSQRLGKPIVEALMACTPIQIARNDGLPALICKLCYMKLDLFTQFQILALKSDEILRRYRKQLRQKNTSFVSQVSPQNVDIIIIDDVKSENEASHTDNHSNDETTVKHEVSKHKLRTPESINNNFDLERVKSQKIPIRYDNEETAPEKLEKLLKNTTVDSDCEEIKIEVNSENETPQEQILNSESSRPDNLSAKINSGTDIVKDKGTIFNNGLAKNTDNGLIVSIKDKLETIVDVNKVANNNRNLKQKNCVSKENDAVINQTILNGSLYTRNSVQNKIDVSEYSLGKNYNLRLKRKETNETVTYIPCKIKVYKNKSSTADVNTVLQTKESSSKTVDSRNHLIGVANELVVAENLLECNICKRVFDCTSALNIHKLFHTDRNDANVSKVVEKSKNIIEEPYRCDVCSKRFKEIAILTQHKLLHNQINMVNKSNDQINTPNQAIVSQQTDSCSSKEQFKKARQVTERCFGCDICNKRFFSSTSLDVHKRMHETRIYECSICSKQFTEEYRLKDHKRKHKKRYTCNICKRKFAFIKNFNNHQKTHSS